MVLRFSLKNWLSKAVALLAVLVACAGLILAALWYLVVGTLTDDRIVIPREVIAAALQYFPNSPRLNERMAAAEWRATDRDLAKAEQYARRAVVLLPNEYTYRLLLGSILEARGERPQAEAALREALALAPHYTEVHWRLANNLARQGKVKESLEHFRVAAKSNPYYLPVTYDLIWNLSGGNLEDVATITGNDPKARLALAQFLLKQSKFAEAADIYSRIDRNAQRTEPEVAAFLTQMIEAGQVESAYGLWLKATSESENLPPTLIWNGGFERAINPLLTQFDWNLASDSYARVNVDSVAHSGADALRISFTGQDTTRLDKQVTQRVMVKPGHRYRLEFYFKTRDLTTSVAPQVAVTDQASTPLTASPPLPEGTRDWTPAGFEFTAPAGAKFLLISVKRLPKYDFDNPSSGVMWFDDFTLKEF